jgi:hypothetical protein
MGRPNAVKMARRAPLSPHPASRIAHRASRISHLASRISHRSIPSAFIGGSNLPGFAFSFFRGFAFSITGP